MPEFRKFSTASSQSLASKANESSAGAPPSSTLSQLKSQSEALQNKPKAILPLPDLEKSKAKIEAFTPVQFKAMAEKYPQPEGLQVILKGLKSPPSRPNTGS
ncbi:hypothetical protein COW36_09720 [bacterium (Candidatus Blackallbacteria) CG17_big_fil_post_rev_8_21_14_2_50_48_46]|uniref:Uncharacterized protein n=1 Tax=bacterium (Candidatus Blackallbacteria) CG17_big_fil_post_rev_8_21_14_2_50_48_46 TaxID=2014261 RepID=A0A2M7G5J3_9BACT|nr:MAG: hypothetical protein COW64_01690 [bacterium (Candidatus Blackallbacteria) CG18_big_fil_WC_8_21_14_2_50_49_26]PIW17238.1 MAG: hypothetical protein COW36_09720 [bacterium (Candidatus Blackallbacteria) CG17_big_fil_post_rev_8_21_14_2_50_48_46]PIW51030.1 MAG: hypothetical protein COW20_00730 [bacterium (Candidatus Blackallbacteria) CG13_big_fil_rev_8_21_14_2_50_49_14]